MIIKTLPLGEVQANCYILIDEKSGEAAVIDCGAFDDSLKKFLESPEIKNIKYILLTHGHFDHIWGVAALKRLTNAKILIHENDEDCLYNEKRSLAYRHFPGQQEIIHADEFIKDGDILRLGESEITIMHTPGHSKGSVCFLAGDNIFTGDTLFCRTVGRTDFPDGDEHELALSIKRLISLQGDYNIYPGHNRATTLDFERDRNRFLRHEFFRLSGEN